MLTPDHQELNLGVLTFGCTKTFSYILSNGYENDLTLGVPIVSCNSCTTASLNKTVLEPGQSAVLTAIYTPGTTGFTTKFITIPYTVNSGDSSIVLKFKAMVNG